MSSFGPRCYAQTATIERATVSKDTTGLQVRTWASVATSVSCSVQPLGEKLAQKIFGRVNVGTAIGFFDYSVDVRTGDRITVGSAAYEALDVLDEAGRNHHWAVALVPHRAGA